MRARTRTIKIKKKRRKIKKQNKVGQRNAIERGATAIVAKIRLDCVSRGFSLVHGRGEKGYTIVWLFFIIIGYFINNYEITVTLWRAGISDGRAASTTGPFLSDFVFERVTNCECICMLRILVPLNARRSSRRPLFSCFPTFESVPKLIPG